MKAVSIARAVFLLACLALVILTLVPGDFLPAKGPFNFWDKTQHALAFAVLTVLGLWGWPRQTLHWRLVVGLVSLGGAIEIAQSLTGWRHGEWSDWVADAIGVASAIFGKSLVETVLRLRAGLWGETRKKAAEP
jgi:hypothetical protein